MIWLPDLPGPGYWKVQWGKLGVVNLPEVPLYCDQADEDDFNDEDEAITPAVADAVCEDLRQFAHHILVTQPDNLELLRRLGTHTSILQGYQDEATVSALVHHIKATCCFHCF